MICSNNLSKFDNLNFGTSFGGFSFSRSGLSKAILARRNFVENLNGDLRYLVLMNQVHGDRFKSVDRSDIIKNRNKNQVIINGVDGLITNTRKIILAVFTADCIPVTIFDQLNNVVAVVHVGWKGVLNDITVKLITFMEKNYKTEISNLNIFFGPAIGACCYEVSQCQDDRVESFNEKYTKNKSIIIKKSGKIHLDIRQALFISLLKMGFNQNKIEMNNLCTCCSRLKLPSHRREGKKRNSTLITAIGLK